MRIQNITPTTSLHYTWHPATSNSTIVTADMVQIISNNSVACRFSSPFPQQKVHNPLSIQRLPCPTCPHALPIKSNLYLPQSVATVFSDPDLHSRPTFKLNFHVHFPLLRSFQRICPNKRPGVTILNSQIFSVTWLAPLLTPRRKTTPCWLSTTAYLIYSQLPSIPAAVSSIRNKRTPACRGGKATLNKTPCSLINTKPYGVTLRRPKLIKLA
jgi:hypothetical protein